MELKDVALIIRKTESGLLIIGQSLSDLPEITDNDEHLFIGSISLNPIHIFKGYEKSPGNTPNELLSKGGLVHGNYKEKIK